MNSSPAGDLFIPRQTNTGLYVQLHNAGRSLDELIRVQEVYRLACSLFNGRYRKTERAFLCHAVGAASSAARFHPRIEFTIAAMLHAAYDSGQFPDGKTGRKSEAHREWLARQVGSEVEEILARYADFDFDTGAPERMIDTPVPDGDEDLLFIALAHEIDDLADGGLAISPKYGESIATRVDACARLARQIANEPLATTIEEHGRIYNDLGWMVDLRRSTLHGFRIAPNLRAYLRMRREHRRSKHVHIN